MWFLSTDIIRKNTFKLSYSLKEKLQMLHQISFQPISVLWPRVWACHVGIIYGLQNFPQCTLRFLSVLSHSIDHNGLQIVKHFFELLCDVRLTLPWQLKKRLFQFSIIFFALHTLQLLFKPSELLSSFILIYRLN